MKNSTLLFCFFFLLSPVAKSQDQLTFEDLPTQVPVYQPVDLQVQVEKALAHPFELTFGAVILGTDGDRYTIPGFFNGGQSFVIRFSPPAPGKWSFRTFSSLAALAGLEGQLSAVENTNAKILGPIKAHPERPQKFIYADGAPYFALAFELDWLFALDHGTPNGIPRTEQLIKEVEANGFNQVVMNVYAYDVGWKTATDVPQKYQYGAPDYSVFAGGNKQPDFDSLNLAFFQHLDRVMEHLLQQGIVAHLMIYVWNKKVNWPPMYSTADNRYFDYVIKRYQAYPNVIWDVSKEALDYGRCDIPYINERIQRIRQLDAYQRLITVHDYEYCRLEPDRVDFISIQNWRNDLYSLSLEALQRHPDKPVMNIEHGGYEVGPYLSFSGNYISPETCLIRNYECIFAGLYSTYYWQNTSWNIVIFDPMNPDQNFEAPRFDYYRHLQALFQRYDFNTLQPHRPKLTTNGRIGADNLASSGYALSNAQGLYLYLLPGTNYQTNVVLPEPPNKQLKATWFNPFTGEFQDGGVSNWHIWKPYRSPWKDTTSILVLEAQ